MKIIDFLLKFYSDHGTKAIGFAQGTVATVAGVSGLIPDGQLKYWLGASALLTFWRGFSNTAAAKKAE